MNVRRTILMRVPIQFRNAIYNKKINMEKDYQRFTNKKISIPMTNILINLAELRTQEFTPVELTKLKKRRKW